MTAPHPITPPPELVEQWSNVAAYDQSVLDNWVAIATQAARWGSDQELEACVQYFHEYDSSWGEDSELISGLRAARRPKPPSLKAQSLASLDKILSQVYSPDAVKGLEPHSDIIRRALEALPND